MARLADPSHVGSLARVAHCSAVAGANANGKSLPKRMWDGSTSSFRTAIAEAAVMILAHAGGILVALARQDASFFAVAEESAWCRQRDDRGLDAVGIHYVERIARVPYRQRRDRNLVYAAPPHRRRAGRRDQVVMDVDASVLDIQSVSVFVIVPPDQRAT